MKKMFCMIALGAITFGTVATAAPIHSTNPTMKADTGKMKMKTKKTKHGTSKMKMKAKDTTMKM